MSSGEVSTGDTTLSLNDRSFGDRAYGEANNLRQAQLNKTTGEYNLTSVTVTDASPSQDKAALLRQKETEAHLEHFIRLYRELLTQNNYELFLTQEEGDQLSAFLQEVRYSPQTLPAVTAYQPFFEQLRQQDLPERKKRCQQELKANSFTDISTFFDLFTQQNPRILWLSSPQKFTLNRQFLNDLVEVSPIREKIEQRLQKIDTFLVENWSRLGESASLHDRVSLLIYDLTAALHDQSTPEFISGILTTHYREDPLIKEAETFITLNRALTEDSATLLNLPKVLTLFQANPELILPEKINPLRLTSSEIRDELLIVSEEFSPPQTVWQKMRHLWMGSPITSLLTAPGDNIRREIREEVNSILGKNPLAELITKSLLEHFTQYQKKPSQEHQITKQEMAPPSQLEPQHTLPRIPTPVPVDERFLDEFKAFEQNQFQFLTEYQALLKENDGVLWLNPFETKVLKGFFEAFGRNELVPTERYHTFFLAINLRNLSGIVDSELRSALAAEDQQNPSQTSKSKTIGEYIEYLTLRGHWSYVVADDFTARAITPDTQFTPQPVELAETAGKLKDTYTLVRDGLTHCWGLLHDDIILSSRTRYDLSRFFIGLYQDRSLPPQLAESIQSVLEDDPIWSELSAYETLTTLLYEAKSPQDDSSLVPQLLAIFEKYQDVTPSVPLEIFPHRVSFGQLKRELKALTVPNDLQHAIRTAFTTSRLRNYFERYIYEGVPSLPKQQAEVRAQVAKLLTSLFPPFPSLINVLSQWVIERELGVQTSMMR
jgi:hypothetical protein